MRIEIGRVEGFVVPDERELVEADGVEDGGVGVEGHEEREVDDRVAAVLVRDGDG